MGLFSFLFKKKGVVDPNISRTKRIKKPPVISSLDQSKVRVKNNGSNSYDVAEAYAENDGDYDYALDSNGVYDFDRDGDGVGLDDDDDHDDGFFDDDDDDDD